MMPSTGVILCLILQWFLKGRDFCRLSPFATDCNSSPMALLSQFEVMVHQEQLPSTDIFVVSRQDQRDVFWPRNRFSGPFYFLCMIGRYTVSCSCVHAFTIFCFCLRKDISRRVNVSSEPGDCNCHLKLLECWCRAAFQQRVPRVVEPIGGTDWNCPDFMTWIAWLLDWLIDWCNTRICMNMFRYSWMRFVPCRNRDSQ